MAKEKLILVDNADLNEKSYFDFLDWWSQSDQPEIEFFLAVGKSKKGRGDKGLLYEFGEHPEEVVLIMNSLSDRGQLPLEMTNDLREKMQAVYLEKWEQGEKRKKSLRAFKTISKTLTTMGALIEGGGDLRVWAPAILTLLIWGGVDLVTARSEEMRLAHTLLITQAVRHLFLTSDERGALDDETLVKLVRLSMTGRMVKNDDQNLDQEVIECYTDIARDWSELFEKALHVGVNPTRMLELIKGRNKIPHHSRVEAEEVRRVQQLKHEIKLLEMKANSVKVNPGSDESILKRRELRMIKAQEFMARNGLHEGIE